MSDRSSVQMTLSVEGLKEAQGMLAGMGERVHDARPAWAEMDHEVSKMFGRQFDTEGRYGGRAWPPLSAATIRGRQKAGRGRGGILRDTNRLWASLVKMGPESLRVMDAQRFERGTTVPYAWPHQLGARVPVREIVPDPLPEDFLGQCEQILLRHIAGEGSN